MGITPNVSNSPRRRVDSPVPRRDRERQRDHRRDAREDRQPTQPTSAEDSVNVDRKLHDFDVRLMAIETSFRQMAQTTTDHVKAITALQSKTIILDETHAEFANKWQAWSDHVEKIATNLTTTFTSHDQVLRRHHDRLHLLEEHARSQMGAPSQAPLPMMSTPEPFQTRVSREQSAQSLGSMGLPEQASPQTRPRRSAPSLKATPSRRSCAAMT